jgi:hypothetical protein
MAEHSGEVVNLTIKVDRGVLRVARHRAFIDRRSINQHLADALEEYADGLMDAARRSMSAAVIFGVVEEHRRVRRQAKKARQPIREPWSG